MGTLKSEIIARAYSKGRISGLTTNPTPGEQELALLELENMMDEWETRNICLGYNFELNPDINSETNVEPRFNNAMITNLMIRLTPDFNKSQHPILWRQAVQSLSTASGWSSNESIRDVQYPVRQPRGSGNTLRYNRWSRFYRVKAEAPIGCETNVMLIGDVDDFQESFAAYLRDPEDVMDFTITSTDGLVIQSSSLTSPIVDYRIEATGSNRFNTDGSQQVKIVATTTLQRIETRIIQFALKESEIRNERQA